MSNPDSFASMSDEAFEEAMTTFGAEESQEPQDEAPVVSTPDDGDTTTDDVESAEDTSTASEDDTNEVVTEEATTNVENSEETTEEELDSEATEATETESDESTSTELDELYKPFKASGRDIQVKDVAEARRLMSMGVDYSEKLHGFKVHRKTIKTLEQHDIDTNKLNMLIDASKGNKDAIAQLIQTHKIDVMDLEVNEDSNYTPSDYSVSDSQVEMDDVISRIQGTTSFATTSDIVTNQWDDASKKVIFDNPQYLSTLNEHVANGTYERVMQEVTKARVLGGLQGLSSLDAYNQVGKLLQQQGAFKPEAPVATVTRKPKPTATNSEQKLRASTPRRAPSTPASKPKYDYASMSDDAFEKLLKT